MRTTFSFVTLMWERFYFILIMFDMQESASFLPHWCELFCCGHHCTFGKWWCWHLGSWCSDKAAAVTGAGKCTGTNYNLRNGLLPSISVIFSSNCWFSLHDTASVVVLKHRFSQKFLPKVIQMLLYVDFQGIWLKIFHRFWDTFHFYSR
jgi:hypothetical protein